MSKKIPWLDRSINICSMYYVLCLDIPSFHRVLKHCGIPQQDYPNFVARSHSNATVHYLLDGKEHKKIAVICIKDYQNKEPVQVAALLCHESVHIVQEHMDDIGETNPSREFVAYAVQNIFQSLAESFVKQTGGKHD